MLHHLQFSFVVVSERVPDDTVIFQDWPYQGLVKIVSEYDQYIPQSRTADKPMAPRVRATHQSPDTRKTN